jgi:hypothetical protein
VTLSALDLLAAIVATLFSAYAGRLLDRLAIYYACAALRVPLNTHSHPLAQGLVHPFPSSIQAPSSEVMVNGLPGWELMRQKAPLAAASGHVEEDSVENLAQATEAGTPLVFSSWQVVFKVCPFSI